MASTILCWKFFSSNKIPIRGTQWYCFGPSRAARESMIYIEGLGICFDIGFKTEENPTHIFISHAHSDHIYGLPAHLLEPACGEPIVIVPRPSRRMIEQMILSHHRATKNSTTDVTNCRFVEVSVPSKIGREPMFLDEKFKIKNMLFKIELFKCVHSIPTTGYGLIENRSKLKKDLIGTPQEKLEEMKRSGIEICEIIETAHFAYLGDTTHHVFYNEKECVTYNTCLEKYGTIFVECTFLHDVPEEIKHAKKKKHMHWVNLKRYIDAHPQINFILGHFSTRYKSSEIMSFFEAQNLPNVFPLINDMTKMSIGSSAIPSEESSNDTIIKIIKETPKLNMLITYEKLIEIMKENSELMAKFVFDVSKESSESEKTEYDAKSYSTLLKDDTHVDSDDDSEISDECH